MPHARLLSRAGPVPHRSPSAGLRLSLSPLPECSQPALVWRLYLLAPRHAASLSPSVDSLPDRIRSWVDAGGQTALLVGSAMFLASLSPIDFRLGRFRILYAIPYTAPLVLYSILLYGVFGGKTPSGAAFFIFPALGILTFVTVVFWGSSNYAIPRRLNVPLTVILGGVAFWACFVLGAAWALTFVESANLLMTALLIGFLFRRFSPGVVLRDARFRRLVALSRSGPAGSRPVPGPGSPPGPGGRSGQGGCGSRHDPAGPRGRGRAQQGCRGARAPRASGNGSLFPDGDGPPPA